MSETQLGIGQHREITLLRCVSLFGESVCLVRLRLNSSITLYTRVIELLGWREASPSYKIGKP